MSVINSVDVYSATLLSEHVVASLMTVAAASAVTTPASAATEMFDASTDPSPGAGVTTAAKDEFVEATCRIWSCSSGLQATWLAKIARAPSARCILSNE